MELVPKKPKNPLNTEIDIFKSLDYDAKTQNFIVQEVRVYSSCFNTILRAKSTFSAHYFIIEIFWSTSTLMKLKSFSSSWPWLTWKCTQFSVSTTLSTEKRCMIWNYFFAVHTSKIEKM